MLTAPLGERSVDLLLVNDPTLVVLQFRVVRHVLAASLSHQALEDGITVAANHDVFAVGAEISIGWHNAGDRGA